MKRCSTCRIEKPASEFHRQAANVDGLSYYCKPCKSERKKAAYHANPDKARAAMARYRLEFPDKVAAAKRAAMAKNPEKYREMCRQNYQSNRAEKLAYLAEYRERNKEYINARNVKYVRERMKRDPMFRLTYAMRNRIFLACRDRRIVTKSKTRDLLGCEWETLRERLETQFQPGMTWDNYGKWHVDHIVPLALAKTEEDMARLCHYSNLQPLWAEDNIRKGAKAA